MLLADPTQRSPGHAISGGVVGAVAATAPNPDALAESTLQALGAQLDACHTARGIFNLLHKEEDDPFYDQHWDLRAKINAIPIRTLADAKINARAAVYALEYDEAAECDCPGSFVELSRSILAFLIAPIAS